MIYQVAPGEAIILQMPRSFPKQNNHATGRTMAALDPLFILIRFAVSRLLNSWIQD